MVENLLPLVHIKNLFQRKQQQSKVFLLTIKFSPENQDKMGAALIEGRGITIEMIKNNPVEAALRLARICWYPSFGTNTGVEWSS